MDIGITIFAQIAVLTVVCAAPILAFGIKLVPATTRAGYVRKQLGER